MHQKDFSPEEKFVSLLVDWNMEITIPNLVESSILALKKQADATEVQKLVVQKIRSVDFTNKYGNIVSQLFNESDLIDLCGYYQSSAVKNSYKNQSFFSQVFLDCKRVVEDVLDGFPSESPNLSEGQDFVFSITDETFEEEVMQSKRPVVIKAYGLICPPCKVLAPIFSSLSVQMHEKVRFVQFDAQKEFAIAKRLEITSLPALVFVNNGEIVKKTAGLMAKDSILIAMLEAFVE